MNGDLWMASHGKRRPASRNGTECRRPHDQREMSTTERRRRQVDGRITRLQVGSRWGAEQEEAGEQQRERIARGCRHDKDRSQRRNQIRGGQARSASVALHPFSPLLMRTADAIASPEIARSRDRW